MKADKPCCPRHQELRHNESVRQASFRLAVFPCSRGGGAPAESPRACFKKCTRQVDFLRNFAVTLRSLDYGFVGGNRRLSGRAGLGGGARKKGFCRRVDRTGDLDSGEPQSCR